MIISALVLRFCCAQVRLLHDFSEGDVPSAMAVPPSPGPGLPYLGILESAALFGLLADFLRASGLSGHVRDVDLQASRGRENSVKLNHLASQEISRSCSSRYTFPS